MGHVINHVTLQGGIGGDDAIDSVFDQGGGYLINFIQAEVGAILTARGTILLILRGQLLLPNT